jgi:type IV pilus assembly protein PilO
MALPAIFDPIVNAPRSQRILLGVVGVVTLVGLAYFFLLSPIEARISRLRAEHASLQRELVESRRIVADLGRFRAEVAELEKRVELIKEKLPNEREMPALYRTLSDAAFQSGLGVGLFQPREPKVSDYFIEIPIAMVAEGGYHQFGQFFERIAGFPRVVNIVEWKLSGPTKGTTALVKADLTLATYMYRPVGSAPVSKPAPRGGARPAPAPPAPARR